MDVEPFGLERWFAEHEHGADLMLAESGIRSLPADRFDTDPGRVDYVIPTNGDPELRERIGREYGRPPGEVCCTTGTQEANFLVYLSLLDPGDHAVVVAPTYQALASVPAAVADVTRVELTGPDWELDVDAVADAVRPDTRLVALANPNNPTGRYHPRETVEALYDLAADAGAYLLCDEVYRLLASDPLDPVAAMGDRGISTTSLTKAYGLAGCRFGWVAGPPEVVDAVWEWKDYTTISPSIFGQHLARQAVDRRESILEENRTLANRNRRIVAEFLGEYDLDWHHPVGVNGFPEVPEEFADAREFCRRVVDEESVVLAPGDAFGFPDRFRIGFGLETDRLREGLDRVGACIDRR